VSKPDALSRIIGAFSTKMAEENAFNENVKPGMEDRFDAEKRKLIQAERVRMGKAIMARKARGETLSAEERAMVAEMYGDNSGG
jgi:hypothetical protein